MSQLPATPPSSGTRSVRLPPFVPFLPGTGAAVPPAAAESRRSWRILFTPPVAVRAARAETATMVAHATVEAIPSESVSHAPVEPESATLDSVQATPPDNDLATGQLPVRSPWTPPVLEAIDALLPESAPALVTQPDAPAAPPSDVHAEALPEVQAEVVSEVTPEVQAEVVSEEVPEAVPEVQHEVQAEVQPEVETEVQPEGQPEVMPEVLAAEPPALPLAQPDEPPPDSQPEATAAVAAAAPADELSDALAWPDASVTTSAEPEHQPAVAPDQALAGIAEELHESAAPWAHAVETEFENDPWSRTALAEMFPDLRATVASSLERIAQRIREGDVSISRDASTSTDAGALAAVLAALLRETARH
ncbi:MAG TPA: hypothetical protein VFW89_09390 [Gemmatimonadaceae bacterium]|nr:hypothetical protein [Gemmatimonadaceae bacterium]